MMYAIKHEWVNDNLLAYRSFRIKNFAEFLFSVAKSGSSETYLSRFVAPELLFSEDEINQPMGDLMRCSGFSMLLSPKAVNLLKNDLKNGALVELNINGEPVYGYECFTTYNSIEDHPVDANFTFNKSAPTYLVVNDAIRQKIIDAGLTGFDFVKI